MAAKNHVHTYYKVNKKDKTAHCADPYCTHFISTKLLLGKASKCNVCGNEFLLSREDLRRARPRCLQCSQTKEALKKQRAMAVVQALLPKVDEKILQQPDSASDLPSDTQIEQVIKEDFNGEF